MIPENTDTPLKADCNPRLVLPLRVIDLDSPFLFGVGRDMTDEERENAEKHGRYDNPPMSVLGVTHEGLAAVDGKDLAQLFVASPQMLAALERLEKACNAVHEVCGGTPQHEAMWLAQLEARDAITEATGIPWQNSVLSPPTGVDNPP